MIVHHLSYLPWEKTLLSFVFIKETLKVTGQFFGQYEQIFFLQKPKIFIYHDEVSTKKKCNDPNKNLKKAKIFFQSLYILYKEENKNFHYIFSFPSSIIPLELYNKDQNILYIQNPFIQTESLSLGGNFIIFYPSLSIIKGEYFQGKNKISYFTKNKKTNKNLNIFLKKIHMTPNSISFSGISVFSVK